MAGEPSSTHDGTTEGNSGLLLKALRDREISTFTIEGEELLTPGGDEIPQALVTEIQKSKIAIVVLTGGYHDVPLRRWKVLAYILDYFQRNPQLIIPVYYTGRSAAPAGILQKRKTGENVYELPKTMAQVDNLPGWDYKWYNYTIDEFNRIIASQVSKMLNRARLDVAVYLVGLESRLEKVWRLMRLTSSYREFLNIGFYGMQGIGKSTLARAVYHSVAHLFDVSCFLHNIRENSNAHGLVGVQKMLLSEISGETDIQLENVSEGVSVIVGRLRGKDVLLILDDVDSLDQLEALGRGPGWRFSSKSIVIITTRGRRLLTYHGHDMLLYDVPELNDEDALGLLCHRAFEHGNVDPRYTDVLNRAIRYASGLPLVLNMIGSYMCGKSVDECEKALVRLERIPLNDIQTIQGALTRMQSALTYNDIQSIQGGALTTSWSDPEAPHISLGVTEETPLNDTTSTQTESNTGVTSRMDFQKWMWILVFVVSYAVGLPCNALSSFKDRKKSMVVAPVQVISLRGGCLGCLAHLGNYTTFKSV